MLEPLNMPFQCQIICGCRW